MSQIDQNKFIEKIKHLLSQVNIQTYLYAILAIGAIILIVSNARLGNKSYLVNKNSDTECRDPHGKIIKIDGSKGEGCVDIFGAAKDYGVDLSYIDNSNPNSNTNNTDNNMTLDMSKDLILTNIYLDQNGVTDPTVKGKILANVISGYSNQIAGKVYTKADLNLSREENKAAYVSYYNDIVNAIIKYNSDIKNYNISHTATNLSGASDSALLDQVKTNMNDLIKINNDFINTLISIPATNSGSQYQLKLINVISNENVYLESLGNISSDPMKYLALGGDSYLTKFQTDFKNSVSGFDKYFIGLNIIKK